MSLEDNQNQEPDENTQGQQDPNTNLDANSDLPPVQGVNTDEEDLENEDLDEGNDTSDNSDSQGDGQSGGTKPQGRLSKRFSKLTGENKALRAQLAAQQNLQPNTPQYTPPQYNDNQQNANDTLEPNPVDYVDGASDPEFVKATAQFHGKQAYHDEKKQDQVTQIQREQEQAVQDANSNWISQANQGIEKYDDWDVAMSSIDGQLNPQIQMQLMKSNIAGDLAYYLGKNPQLVQNLNTMTKEDSYMELGRITAHVNGGVSSRTQKSSKMSEPVDTVNTGKPARKITYDDNMSQADFDKLYPVVY